MSGYEEIRKIRLTCGVCGKKSEFLNLQKARAWHWQAEWRPKEHIRCEDHKD